MATASDVGLLQGLYAVGARELGAQQRSEIASHLRKGVGSVETATSRR
jgi:hypothetical protein